MRKMYNFKRMILIFLLWLIITIPLYSTELRIRISCQTELVVECNDDDVLNEVIKLHFDNKIKDCQAQPINRYRIKINVSYSTSTQSKRITISKIRQPVTGKVIKHYYKDVKNPVCDCSIDILFFGKEGFISKEKLQKSAIGYYKDKQYPCSQARTRLHTELGNIILNILLKKIQIQNTPSDVLNTYLIKIMSSKKKEVIEILKDEKYKTNILNVEYWLKNIAINFQDTCSFLSFIDLNNEKNIDFIKKHFDYYDSYYKKEAISNIFPSLKLIQNNEFLFSHIINRNTISKLNLKELNSVLNNIISLSQKDSLFEKSFLLFVERSEYSDKIKTRPEKAFFEIDKFKSSDFESFKFVNAIDDIINAHAKSNIDKNFKKALYNGLFFEQDSKHKLFFYINDCCLNNLYFYRYIRDYAKIFSIYVSSKNCYLFKWYLNAFISDESDRGMQLKEKYSKQYFYSAKMLSCCYSYDYIKGNFRSAQWTYFNKPYNKHKNRLLNYLKKVITSKSN